MTQATRDAIADAETLRLVAREARRGAWRKEERAVGFLVDAAFHDGRVTRAFRSAHFSPWHLAAEAVLAARAAFEAVPELRG